jgi:hypothetical protein
VRLAGGIPEWKLYSSFHLIVERSKSEFFAATRKYSAFSGYEVLDFSSVSFAGSPTHHCGHNNDQEKDGNEGEKKNLVRFADPVWMSSALRTLEKEPSPRSEV